MTELHTHAKQTLWNVPMFKELSEEEMEGLSRIAILRKFGRKRVIFHEGSPKEAVYFIRDGLIKTVKTDEKGHERIMSFLKAGDMFPHTGLFHDAPYPATAIAITDTDLLAMPIKPFEHFILETPSVAVKLMRVMSNKIRELQEKLQEMSGQDVHDRAQTFLLKLAERYGTEKEDGSIYIEMPLTHQDFASAIGTTRETVNRMLNQLRKDQVLEADRTGIHIRDLSALRTWKSGM